MQRASLRRLFAALLLAGFAVARPAPAQAPSPPAPAPATAGAEPLRVVLHDEAPYFDPKVIRVPLGGTVVWENRGPGLSHTVYFRADSGLVGSGPIRPGRTWSYTFRQATVLRTWCEIHPYMDATVIAGDVAPGAPVAADPSTSVAGVGSAPAEIVEFPLSVPNSVPGILAVDANDDVWVTMGGGGWANIEHPPLGYLGRINLRGEQEVLALPTAASGPSGILFDGEGRLLVTELMGGKIARVDPRSRSIEEFTIPTETSWPTGLALDPEGNLWFNETKGNKVGRMTPEGVISELAVPTPRGNPTGMVADLEGNIWIAQRDGNKIARISPGGTIREYAIPTPRAKPTGMAVDRENRVWFAEREGNKLAVVEGDRIREFPLPRPHSGPFFLLFDEDGFLWFSETFGNRIGRFDPRTTLFVEYDIPTRDSWPGGLAFDRAGNLWFAEQLANKVAVLRNARPY